MHLSGMTLQTGGNGIKTRLQFLKESDEFSRCKMDGWIGEQEVDDLAAPEKFGSFAIDARQAHFRAFDSPLFAIVRHGYLTKT